MRFIGSKERLLTLIEGVLKRYVKGSSSTVGDLFCGTASVARLLKSLGYRVTANDNLKFCSVLAEATLLVNEEPRFERLLASGQVLFRPTSGLFPNPYDMVLKALNELPGVPGFIFREYSPGGTARKRFRRRYFSDDNAQRIDAIRSQIATWHASGLLTGAESSLLISDLIRAANRVANIAGTYGCFLKHWDDRARRPLVLECSQVTPSSLQHEVFCAEANDLAKSRSFDVLYLDPPYTWRHYGAYYHILETIAVGDTPAVTGRTGLRPWESSKSRFCDRSSAREALEDLVSAAKCEHLFLSYNSEGLIKHDEIMDVLRKRGKPTCTEIAYRRYRSNNGGTRARTVKERLYYVRII